MDTSQDMTYNSDIIQTMLDYPFFSFLNENDIKTLLRNSKIMVYKSGEIVFEEGQHDTLIYYLISGKVRVVKAGKEICSFNDTGSIFGEIAGIDGETRSASIYAVEDTMCLAIDLYHFDKISTQNPFEFKYNVYRKCAEILAERLRLTTDDLVRSKNELAKTQEELNRLKTQMKRSG